MCDSVPVFRMQANVPASSPTSCVRTRQFNDTLLADVNFWNYQGREVLVYSMIDEATRFHVTQILPAQSGRDLYLAIMTAWVKWAGAPRFLLVDPHRSHQGTTVLVGAAEASWTRGLVERHGAYARPTVEKMVHDAVPDDVSAHSLFDKATSAKNMMSRIRGNSPSQWVLATQPRIPESLVIDDEDEDLCLTRTSPKVKTMNLLVRFVSEMQPAVLSSPWTQIKGFAGPQSLLLVLIG